MEVAAVSGEVVSVVSGEKTAENWRKKILEDSEDTMEAIDVINNKWENALKHEVVEDMYDDLCLLRGLSVYFFS